MLSNASMSARIVPGLAVGAVLLAAPAAAQAPAQPLSAAAEPAQFYVFSFTNTPIAEAATDIVTGALAYDLTVDPAVEGVVTFRADGWSSGEALLQDFGSALLDQDVALVRTGAGAYAVIPRANVPMLLARGGVLMRVAEPATAAPPEVVAPPGSRPVYGRARWWDGAAAALSIFVLGALAGAGALFGGQVIWRRNAPYSPRLDPPLLRLTHRPERPARTPIAEADPDLVIPRFDEGS